MFQYTEAAMEYVPSIKVQKESASIQAEGKLGIVMHNTTAGIGILPFTAIKNYNRCIKIETKATNPW